MSEKSIKISVVMASFLGDYEFAATDRIHKFHRAVESFLNQSYPNKELIVVSDGCYETVEQLLKYSEYSFIKVIKLDKQPLFSGNIRNVGCFVSTGDIICYLDTDDFLGVNHLNAIASSFIMKPELDWVYYDDYVVYGFNPITYEILTKGKREVELSFGSIGTSSIAHRKMDDVSWEGCDGYNHDWAFIEKLIEKNNNVQKIGDCEYNVCHIPTQIDC